MSEYIVVSNNGERTEQLSQSISDIFRTYKENTGAIISPICEKTLSRAVGEVKGINITIEPDSKLSVLDEGILMPVRGGFIIKYGTMDKNLKSFSYSKIRETICHELAHILFYDCSHPIPRLKEAPPEYLCHDVARQLLLPGEVVREKFFERIEVTSDLIAVIEQLSRDFQVASMLIVRRLTEDLALLKDTMFTFWRYISGDGGRYNSYQPDPKLSSDLRKVLPKYWRDQVHLEVWNKVVSKVAVGYSNNLPDSLHVCGKKRNKDGVIKSLLFSIQCVPLYDRSYNVNYSLPSNIQVFRNLLSVAKFHLP